jgi:hypothetical protein
MHAATNATLATRTARATRTLVRAFVVPRSIRAKHARAT